MDFRKFLDPIWDLALKMVSKFVVPKFRDTLSVPKITKCGDLLYTLYRSIFYSGAGYNGASMIKRPIIIFEHFFEIQATVHWTRNRRQIMKKLVLRLCMRHEHRWKQVRWLFILHVYNVEIKVVKLDILPMYVVCACFSCSVHTCWK